MSALRLAQKYSRIMWKFLAGDEAVRRAVWYRLFPLYYKVLFRLRPPGKPGQRKVFLDLGANVGGGFDFFSQVFSPLSYDYHFVEPNPTCLPRLKEHVVKSRFANPPVFQSMAAWIRNETLHFYGVEESRNEITEGGSVVARHNGALYNVQPEKALEVQGRDMAEYLGELQKSYDVIIIKMDIEGAELEVLEHLWRQPGLFVKETVMFVEFHAYCLASPEARAEAAAKEQHLLREHPSRVRIYRWF